MLLEHQLLVCLYGPFPLQIHRALDDTFNQVFLPEPAGVTARTSGGNPPAPGQGLDHTLDVVITIERLLPLNEILQLI